MKSRVWLHILHPTMHEQTLTGNKHFAAVKIPADKWHHQNKQDFLVYLAIWTKAGKAIYKSSNHNVFFSGRFLAMVLSGNLNSFRET